MSDTEYCIEENGKIKHIFSNRNDLKKFIDERCKGIWTDPDGMIDTIDNGITPHLSPNQVVKKCGNERHVLAAHPDRSPIRIPNPGDIHDFRRL